MEFTEIGYLKPDNSCRKYNKAGVFYERNQFKNK